MAVRSKKSFIFGFTLIELLVVMSIIAILAGMTVVFYEGNLKKSRDGKRKTELEQVRSALEMCRSDTGSYPEGTLPNHTLVSGDAITCGGTTYMTIPNDPSAAYRYYYNWLSASSYQLCAYLEIPGSANCGATGYCNAAGTIPCNYKTSNP